MTRFCSDCGQAARPEDRFCVGCGAEINSNAPSGDTSHVFRPESHPHRRAGGFVARHARVLMAVAVVAVIGVIAAVFGSSEDTTPRAEDVAPPSLVAEEDSQAALPTLTPIPTSTAPPKVVTAKSSNGKTYSCSIGAVLDRVDEAHDEVTRRERVLRSRRAAVRKLERQYPSGRAPAAVVDRYDRLFARANAQVRWTNKAVARYNKLLRDECTRQ
jgi:hypothetical protein